MARILTISKTDNRLYCQHPLPRPKKASVKAAAQKKKKLATNGAAISETDDTEPVWELVSAPINNICIVI
jgi:hypothetical protein